MSHYVDLEVVWWAEEGETPLLAAASMVRELLGPEEAQAITELWVLRSEDVNPHADWPMVRFIGSEEAVTQLRDRMLAEAGAAVNPTAYPVLETGRE